MSRSTYISENITGEQLRLINELSELEIEWFRLEDLSQKLEHSYKNIHESIENLAHKGILKRAERGLYFNSNFNDSYVIGNQLARNSAIAYWSALNIHGLTSRFPNTIFVQTTHRKKNKTVFGVDFKFITVSKNKFIGITSQGYGNLIYKITDVEKTLVDCFDLPQYSGGFDGLIAAFSMAKLNSQKMIKYCASMNNIALTKRMGFLAQLFQKRGTRNFISWALRQVNKRYNLIDSGGLDNGEFVTEWRIRLNVSKQELKNLATEIY